MIKQKTIRGSAAAGLFADFSKTLSSYEDIGLADLIKKQAEFHRQLCSNSSNGSAILQLTKSLTHVAVASIDTLFGKRKSVVFYCGGLAIASATSDGITRLQENGSMVKYTNANAKRAVAKFVKDLRV